MKYEQYENSHKPVFKSSQITLRGEYRVPLKLFILKRAESIKGSLLYGKLTCGLDFLAL